MVKGYGDVGVRACQRGAKHPGNRSCLLRKKNSWGGKTATRSLFQTAAASV